MPFIKSPDYQYILYFSKVQIFREFFCAAGIVGYSIQTAVEADNHLIVAHEVTMLGFDRDALSMMAVAARDAMTTDQLTASVTFGSFPTLIAFLNKARSADNTLSRSSRGFGKILAP